MSIHAEITMRSIRESLQVIQSSTENLALAETLENAIARQNITREVRKINMLVTRLEAQLSKVPE